MADFSRLPYIQQGKAIGELGEASFSPFAFGDLPKRATVRARLGDPLTGGRSSFIATDRSHLPPPPWPLLAHALLHHHLSLIMRA